MTNSKAAALQAKSGFLQSLDQTPLFYRHYPAKKKRATILVVHGFGEHCGRYSHVVERLNDEDFEVFCVDLRGHGQSKGTRGDVEKFSHYEEDVQAGVDLCLRNKGDDTKFFILAHSMGALISLSLACKNKITSDGMVLSAPLLGAKLKVPFYKRATASALSKVCPRLLLDAGISGKQLSADEHMANGYDEDPLVLKKVSIRAYREITMGYQRAWDYEHTGHTPYFMQLAGLDPLVDPNAAKRWFDERKHHGHDASLKCYPDFLHEIYNEVKRDEAISDFVAWLNERV